MALSLHSHPCRVQRQRCPWAGLGSWPQSSVEKRNSRTSVFAALSLQLSHLDLPAAP